MITYNIALSESSAGSFKLGCCIEQGPIYVDTTMRSQRMKVNRYSRSVAHTCTCNYVLIIVGGTRLCRCQTNVSTLYFSGVEYHTDSMIMVLIAVTQSENMQKDQQHGCLTYCWI